MTGLVLALALAAADPQPLAAPASVEAATGKPEWLDAQGAVVSEQTASPEAAMAWAELLVRESSFPAASRAYENLARRWPRAPGAESAMLCGARAALAARQFDRAEALLAEGRARWPRGETAIERDQTFLLAAEGRLAAAEGENDAAYRDVKAPDSFSPGREAEKALKSFTLLWERDRAGPCAERAALGRARSWLALENRPRATKALEEFLNAYPRSDLVPEARRLLAEAASTRARGKARERTELAGAIESATWAGEQAERANGEAESEEARAIRETYRAIAARQAELKMEEARLYLRRKRQGAAETVLRGILARYGDTPSARDAAKLLEELAR